MILATPLEDSVGIYNYMVNEQQESFYSFTPWWSGADNRTMIFFAAVIYNKVLFYMDVNDYPLWFQSGW